MGVSDWGDVGFGESGGEVSGEGSVVLFLYERAGECEGYVVLLLLLSGRRKDDAD